MYHYSDFMSRIQFSHYKCTSLKDKSQFSLSKVSECMSTSLRDGRDRFSKRITVLQPSTQEYLLYTFFAVESTDAQYFYLRTKER